MRWMIGSGMATAFALWVVAAMAQEKTAADFSAWVRTFKAEAVAEGFSPELLDQAFDGVSLNATVLERDGRQFEFVTPPGDYLERLVSDARVAAGIEARQRAAGALARIEERYQVPASVVAAIWGVESNYGDNRGDFSVVESYATLAFDGRRGDWARAQLSTALGILKSGDAEPETLKGSWAGAMGHTQFIPSSYERLAVDFDGDGKRDIWSEDPTDALASTANYLAQRGWTPGEPWGLHVKAPREFDYGRAAAKRRSTDEWAELGVTMANGDPLPTGLTEAELFLPAGARGPQLLLLNNFRVILTYNNSSNYALAVSLLAERLDGKPPRLFSWPTDDRPLTISERKELQETLTELGYDAGSVDGILGPKSRAAIRQFQSSRSMVADAYPSEKLLDLVRRAKAAKDAPILVVRSGPAEEGDIREMQALLTSLGYDTRGVDGRLGPRTKLAISNFRRDQGLPASNEPTIELLNALRDAVRRGG